MRSKTPKTPKSLLHGHEHLYADIKDIISMGGKVGKKAEFLSDLLYSHFQKEEEYALPPLSLLLALSEGNWKVDTKAAISMSNKFQSIMEEMKKEHNNIDKVLVELKTLADEENNSKAKLFVQNLRLHIELEDQVLYPATILVGNYLKKFEK